MTSEKYKELLGVLPQKDIEYAFAYGSGALQQRDESIEEKMVDFVVVTRNPISFHEENLIKNPSHYSFLRILGPKMITRFQCNLGARVYYNTQVQAHGRKIKYGVISYDNMKQDLLDWRWIYVAGRLHKPVLEVVQPSEDVENLVLENRRSALHAALLLLPDSFSLKELFNKIVSLSYVGDFRMIVGEDKNKVAKIVDGSFPQLFQTYEPLMNDDARLSFSSVTEKVMQDASTAAVYHRLNLLPSEVVNRLQKSWNKKHNRQRDTEEVLFSLSHRHDVGVTLETAISSIIRPSSLSQTAKNAVSAGLVKSIIYSSAKMLKMFKSK
ncbi:unnamed protein product [Caenorhabditis auriculariae]|uniref:Phosphatidate cytidylyltransferase, mitochondrial n=1 Tax=Caenorhabditis auriculariae TaxID=2777116 RepID=A0A8S1GME5_9PELO|nr:unnamed protein product [Caenorhabditis auriculariae]